MGGGIDQSARILYISTSPLPSKSPHLYSWSARIRIMAKTIQEMLAEKASGDPQPVQYVDTVEAYDKWAEVRLDSFL